MPQQIRTTSRRMWITAWAVLCVAGLAGIAGLRASSAPDPRPGQPGGAECGEYIANIEAQLAKADQERKEDGVLGFSGIRGATEGDCRDELRDHFRGDR
ncbi:hypothetical protein [Streptomyces sp. NPDC017413]|uniref:hypothetical protein n=1 Tax=unclassified Streptomyces TaxID=2593676 RepID=UPI0037A2705A